MGSLRYLLACAVVASHLGITLYGFNIGVMAVVVFYMLAGQVVVKLLYRQPHQPFTRRLRVFYWDRFLRIAPMYTITLLVAILIWWGAKPESYFLSRSPDLFDWLANILVVPLAYFMYTGQDQFTLLPPAWSLAVELQFYLLVPFLLQSSRRLALAFILSLLVFIMAQTQQINVDYFGYRLLPGVLFIFILGAYSLQPNPRTRLSLWGLCLLCCFYAAFLLLLNITVPFNFEVAIGLTLGLICLLSAPHWQRTLLPRAWQTRLGAWSYGVFLVHMPIMWLVEPYIASRFVLCALIILLSTFYAALCHRFFEQPIWQRFRPYLG